MPFIQHSWVICGFPGIGKTDFHNKFRVKNIKLGTQITSIDYVFHTGHEKYVPENYIEDLQNELKKNTNLILTDCNPLILDKLEELQIKHLIIYPNKTLKPAYIRRYIQTYASFDFIKQISDNWDAVIDNIKSRSNEKYSILIELQEGEYLSDIF